MPRFRYLFTTLLVVLLAGCDSATDEVESTRQWFQGNWPLVGAYDDRGDLTPAVEAQLNSVLFKFRKNYTFSLTLDAKDDQYDTVVTGTYDLDVVDTILTLSANVPESSPCFVFSDAGKAPLLFIYVLDGEGAPGGEGTPPGGPNELGLITADVEDHPTVQIFNCLLQTDFEGIVGLGWEVEDRET
jgi:hypothetical protein